MAKKERAQGWKLKGRLPWTVEREMVYDQKEFADERFVKLNIRLFNCGEDQVLCSFADYSTEGQFTATWNSVEDMNQSIRMQRRDSFELQYLIRGELHGFSEYGPYTMHPGDMRFLNRNVLDKEEVAPGNLIATLSITNDFFETYFSGERWVELRPSAIRDFIRPNLGKEPYKNRDFLSFQWLGGETVGSAPYQLFEQLYRELSEKRPGFEPVAAGLTSRLFAVLFDPKLYRVEKISHIPQTKDELAVELKKYMDSTHRKVTKQELSERFHFHEDYLARIFQESTGDTFRHYNQKICMNEAATLLRGTDLSIEEILARIDYSGKAHFYRIFADYYHMTPMEYRKANQ